MLLENDKFLTSLSNLYTKSSSCDCKAVFTTFKQYSWKKKDKSAIKASSSAHASDASSSNIIPSTTTTTNDEEFPCLVRSTMGSKLKISTLVHPDDTDTFNEAYFNIIKLHMTSLKKKERKKQIKKKKKKKSTATSTSST